ncbi:MAG: hypothetical protein ACRDJ5_11215, partial [Actinomycetota bacterium]
GEGTGTAEDAVVAEAFVSDVCGVMVSLQAGTQRMGRRMVKKMQGADSPKEAGQTLAGSLEDYARRVDRAIEEVEAVGVPDVDNGREAADRLTSFLADMKSAFEGAAERVRKLPTGSPEQFGRGVQRIFTSFSTRVELITQPLEEAEFGSAPLEEAAGDDPTCRQLERL